MDWLIADCFVIPEAAQRCYSERIANQPRCYQPSDSTRVLAPAPARAACGLPEDAVAFASFNLSWKLDAASFARMCRVLRQVPNGVLWLLTASPAADARLRAAAHAQGVDPGRLIFAPRLTPARHLARLQLADLFLDTNPYNAHTTASDAIWAGCPVLTCPGDTFASRVAGSLNHFLGMPELNAASDDDFVALGVRLGNARAALATLRTKLTERRATSGLFDMHAYASAFAALLQRLAKRDETT
jgi:predicted O-linked N-acetylglucosamine transferase (SPINDLY family)